MDPATLDAVDAACPARRLLGRLAERWTGLVLVVLADGRDKRFSEIAREIGNISAKMLSQTLRALERDGLVARHVKCGAPSRPLYRPAG
jgi:DNA-binding HxlR family transcriptional regulator